MAFEPGWGHWELFGIERNFRDRIYPCATSNGYLHCAGDDSCLSTAPRRAPVSAAVSALPSALKSFTIRRLGLGHGPIRRAHLEAREAPHRDVLAQLGHLGRHNLRDGLRLVLDERLVQQAELLVELAQLALSIFSMMFGGLPVAAACAR
jgi:hypothetical protein